MEKEFIPYEQALALKELGFDEPCFGSFKNDVLESTYANIHYCNNMGRTLAPLYQQAFRWFREKYQDDFYINKWIDDKYWYHIPFLFGSIKEKREYRESFSTYEEAELECLKKLIELCKSN